MLRTFESGGLRGDSNAAVGNPACKPKSDSTPNQGSKPCSAILIFLSFFFSEQLTPNQAVIFCHLLGSFLYKILTFPSNSEKRTG